MRHEFPIRPLAHIYQLDQAPLNAHPLSGHWPSLNVRMDNGRITRRWDLTSFRELADGEMIYHIPIYRSNSGDIFVLGLTEHDLIQISTQTGQTYRYRTLSYSTGTIINISGNIITGSTTAWLTSGIKPGDQFILTDDYSEDNEPNSAWATIESVDGDTQITLTGNYIGTTGSFSPTGKTYLIRKLYSLEPGKRWTFATVAGNFCFGNGNDYAQFWDGSATYATRLNETYANKVKYMTAYANRLLIANMYDPDTSSVNPWLLRWSKEGDPTDFTDTTAGFVEFSDSEEPIMGLAVAGPQLIVFKRTSYHAGFRTGESTNPLIFPNYMRGIGCVAPHSIVQANGTVYWLGDNDFYFISGTNAMSIGGPIRKKFFELTDDRQIERTYALANHKFNEIIWVAETSQGQYAFVYNWKENIWLSYSFDDNLTSFGWYGS